MDLERFESSLEGIRHLLTHLHGEVIGLEESYTQVLRVLRKLEHACEVDDLTGLLRRRSFFQKWNSLLEECQRLNESSGVLLIDIDHFKQLNDTHGHPTGDEALKRVADLLRQFESPYCTVGRYGGEEFAVAVRGSEAELLSLAERIRKGAEQLHGPIVGADGKPSSNIHWKCTLSVGVAMNPGQSKSTESLLKAADDALYVAKKNGRNQVRAA